MDSFFRAPQRALQDHFDRRALADRVASITVHDEVQEPERLFIESRDLFFLSTVDEAGQPTCSYKGGAPGLVRVVDTRTIAFPNYDGNGMFLSMGNISASGKVGLLFIDLESPHRIRLHGTASVGLDDPLLASWPGANLVVRVKIAQLFVNCPRYIHRHQRIESSAHVPQAGCEPPPAQWKRIDAFQDVLNSKEQSAVAAEGGALSFDQYLANAQAGKG